jgi:hypothetical protein
LVKNGVPPTERNARTGELTPPGMSFFAFVKSSLDLFILVIQFIYF